MMENAAAMEKKVDKTYRSNYRSYCKFVEEQGLATEAPSVGHSKLLWLWE